MRAPTGQFRLPVVGLSPMTTAMADILTPAYERPGLLSRAVKAFIIWLFRVTGWRAAGRLPEGGKFILAGANHCLHADAIGFLLILAAEAKLGIQSCGLSGCHSCNTGITTGGGS